MKRPLAAALVVLALFVLPWTRQPIHYVGPSDAANYLAAARSGHVLYDKKPYVIHPPAYPLAVRAAALVAGGEARGALLLGLGCQAALVLVTFLLALELARGRLGAAVLGALLLVFSRALAYHAQGIFREPWQVLLVHLAVLVVLKGSARWAPLGVPAALTWDPIGVAAPVLAASGFVAKRTKPALALALVVLVSWLGWATWRARLLASAGTYPAGIDGMVEETTSIPPGAFVNPNFFAETKRHNSYFWSRRPTPLHLVEQAGPNLLAEDVLYADYPQPASFLVLGVATVLLAALGAAVVETRPLVAWALPVGFLGAPGLLGNTSRYSMVLVPLVCVLAGAGLEHLVRRRAGDLLEKKPWLLLVAALVPLGATVATHPVFAPARQDVFETRSVAAVASAMPDAKIAAYVGWPPELCWLLPDARVVALPLRVERLDAFLASEDPDLLVVPVAEPRVVVPGGDPALREVALGLPVLAEVAARQRSGALVLLGFAFEAETSDRPRLHAYVVLGRPRPGRTLPRPFGFHLPAGEALDAARAIDAGGVEPAELALLRAHR
ncbi:MAG: hypothetical protein ACAI25_08120, partial [Planctomycetota bacterium]